jgi:hypothetical protein
MAVLLLVLFKEVSQELTQLKRDHISESRFTYCRVSDMESLKTLLKSQVISVIIDEAERGQLGQRSNTRIHATELRISSLNQQNIGGRRLAGLGHKPSKLAITGSNPVDRTNTVFFRAGGDNAL